MRKGSFEMSYYNTYYFSNVINNVVENSFDYLRKIDEFFEYGLALPAKFSKHSSLHQFISFVITGIFDEDLEKRSTEPDTTKVKSFWINHALQENGIEHVSFQDWVDKNAFTGIHHEDLIQVYVYDFLNAPYNELLKKLTSEVFHILFLNREFLLKFNLLIAGHIEMLKVDESESSVAEMLKRDGVLYRASIPTWVKDAVFFRDRGHCVFCDCDLTNLITRLTSKNFDHMVPLNLSGANDVSNIQLTCETCNLEKSGSVIETSKTYELWYKD